MSTGRQQLPDKFNVSTGGQLPQEIFLDREIDLDAWMLEGNDKVRGWGAPTSSRGLHTQAAGDHIEDDSCCQMLLAWALDAFWLLSGGLSACTPATELL